MSISNKSFADNDSFNITRRRHDTQHNDIQHIDTRHNI